MATTYCTKKLENKRKTEEGKKFLKDLFKPGYWTLKWLESNKINKIKSGRN